MILLPIKLSVLFIENNVYIFFYETFYVLINYLDKPIGIIRYNVS